MRRLLLLAAGLAALTLTAPAAALANHGHHRHHKAKRHTHRARVRFEHFGAVTPGAPGSTAPSTGNPPATPPAPIENAGKVASYANGVLTLTLTDGSSVSGKVTNNTRIECVSATAPPPGVGQGSDDGPGDDNGQGDDNHRGDQQPPTPVIGQPQTMQGEDGNDDDEGEEGQGPASEPPCDSSLLVPNAVVRAAELRIGPSGAEFEGIVLVR